MIKTYNFEYGFMDEASATFEVDTEKFTPKMANNVLSFFSWDYDKEADPIVEVMKKYAMTAIKIATSDNYSTYGVTDEFNDLEGYYPVNGSQGIKLTNCQQYEFNEEELHYTVS